MFHSVYKSSWIANVVCVSRHYIIVEELVQQLIRIDFILETRKAKKEAFEAAAYGCKPLKIVLEVWPDISGLFEEVSFDYFSRYLFVKY